MKKQRRYARRLGDQDVACRLMRHGSAMRLVGAHRTRIDGRPYTLLRFTCSCGTHREDVLDSQLRLYSRRYIYPDGYLLDGDELASEGRPDVTTWRAELLRRTPLTPEPES